MKRRPRKVFQIGAQVVVYENYDDQALGFGFGGRVGVVVGWDSRMPLPYTVEFSRGFTAAFGANELRQVRGGDQKAHLQHEN